MLKKIPLQKLLHPSLVFIGGQTAVGALNYLYQVYLTRVLGPLEFGSWSVWFAQFSVSILLALWVQTLTTLDGPAQRKFAWLAQARIKWGMILALSLLSIAALASNGLWVFGTAGWGWALLQSLYYGRALAREELRLVSIAMIAGALFKFSFPIIFATELSCYLGVLMGPLVTVYILAFWEKKEVASPKGHHSAKVWSLLTLGSALMLAVGTAWVPQMDLLMAHLLLDAGGMAQFAKVALVYKAFFFFILILAQLLLSKQVQGGGAGLGAKKLLVIPAGGLLMGGLAVFVFPPTIAPPHWVALGIIHVSTLTYLFLLLQNFASAQSWRGGLLILGLLFAEALSVQWGRVNLFPSLEIYFAVVIACEALLGLILAFRRPPSKIPQKRAA